MTDKKETSSASLLKYVPTYFDDVAEFLFFDECQKSTRAIVPNDAFNLTLKPLPNCCRTILCHDLRNGYKGDVVFQVTDFVDQYFFNNWHMVDFFIYFSHHTITIPPLTWICASHVNGVPILGTIISENVNGTDLWPKILIKKQCTDNFIKNLVDISINYGFDGWFLNIENKIMPFLIGNLLYFVDELTKAMHCKKKNSLVIWYDSVAITGDLEWQNMLNHCNKNFFDLCDGIFLNYDWSEEMLKESLDRTITRKNDIYFGIDLFLRKPEQTFSDKLEKIEMASKYDCSKALFAFSWNYEIKGHKSYYKTREESVWKKIGEYCHTYSIDVIPFWTNFCVGHGTGFSIKGKNYLTKKWSCIAFYRPMLHSFESRVFEDFENKNTCVATVDHTTYYDGGSSILFTCTTVNNSDEFVFIHNMLFAAAYKVTDRFYVEYTYCNHELTKNCDIAIVLYSKNATNALVFVEDEMRSQIESELQQAYSNQNTLVKFLPLHRKKTCSKNNTGRDKQNIWIQKRTDEITPEHLNYIESFWILTYSKNRGVYKFNIGDFKIINMLEEEVNWKSFSIKDVVVKSLGFLKGSTTTFFCKIKWSYEYDDPFLKISYIDIYYKIRNGIITFLGRSVAKGFYLAEFKIPRETTLKFTIYFQPINDAGYRLEPLEKCPTFKKNYPADFTKKNK